jgi:hypothetical protein
MRAGFLSGSEQFAAGVASLREHLPEAPHEEREKVLAALTRLLATHDHLVAKVQRLPPSPWDSFKVMVSAVKAQQTVLDQLGHLVKEHVLPRQLESLTVTPFQGQDPEPPVPEASRGALHGAADDGFPAAGDQGMYVPPEGDFQGNLHARPPGAMHGRTGGGFGPRRRANPGYRDHARGRQRDDDDLDDDEAEPHSLLARARERTAGFRGLAAMVVAGVILSLFPRDMRLQELGSKLVQMVRAAGGSATVAEPPAPPAVGGRSVDRVPASAEAAPAAVQPDPVAEAPPLPPEPKPTVAPRVQEVAAAAGEEEPPLPAAEKLARPKPPPAPAEERYVPVVFTHKDEATVLRALSDLKQQYPNILIGRRGEVQPFSAGKKGIWHRLVFLPAGPRPEAAKVCDELAAQGYDRCWVKEY